MRTTREVEMLKKCEICNTAFTKRRPNSCQKCYFKNRHRQKYQKKPRKCISCGKIDFLGHNVYCASCKNDIKTCDEEHRIYFGRKFYKSINGYWVCCRAKMPWAHRWVWINERGKIPKDLDVHHIDGNKDNNDINNLELITRSEHQKKHWRQGDHDHEMKIRIDTLKKYRKTKS